MARFHGNSNQNKRKHHLYAIHDRKTQEVIRIKLSELSDALREKRVQRQGADLIAFPTGGRQRFP